MVVKVVETGLRLAMLQKPKAVHDTNKCCNSPAINVFLRNTVFHRKTKKMTY